MAQQPQKRVFRYFELRQIVAARKFLRSYGFDVDLMCGCNNIDERDPCRGECLHGQMFAISEALRLAKKKANEAADRQKHLDGTKRYLESYGYTVIPPKPTEKQ